MNARATAGAAGAVLLLVSACGGGGAPAGRAAGQLSSAPQVERLSRDAWKTNFDKHSVV